MEISISKQQLIALFGAILLLIGAFLPVLSAPIVGSVSLFNNGKSDGMIIAGLAVIAIVLAALNYMKAIRIVAVISLVIVIVDFYSVYSRINKMKEEVTSKLGDNPFQGLATTMLDSVQLQYGWVVLFLGCAVLLVSAFFKVVDPTERRVRSEITEGRESPVINSALVVRKCKFCDADMPSNSLKCNACGSIN